MNLCWSDHTPNRRVKQVFTVFIDERGVARILWVWYGPRGVATAEYLYMSLAMSPVLGSFPDTRRDILQYIKKSGEAGAEEIAARAGITLSGARQHLTGLERDGLVTHTERRDGPGRPKHAYTLTPAGDALFPRAYAELANELLTYVEDEDPELLLRVFDKRARRRLAQCRARTA